MPGLSILFKRKRSQTGSACHKIVLFQPTDLKIIPQIKKSSNQENHGSEKITAIKKISANQRSRISGQKNKGPWWAGALWTNYKPEKRN